MFMCRPINYFIKNEEYFNRHQVNGLNMNEFIIQQPPTVNVRNFTFLHNPVFIQRYNNLQTKYNQCVILFYFFIILIVFLYSFQII